MNRGVARALATASLGFLIACGSDPTYPRISALRLSPEGGVRPAETLDATVDFVDPDGDLPGGRAEIGLWRREEPEGDVYPIELGGESEETRGTITLSVGLPAGVIPGRYALSVTVIDAPGRRSNPLVADFDVLR